MGVEGGLWCIVVCAVCLVGAGGCEEIQNDEVSCQKVVNVKSKLSDAILRADPGAWCRWENVGGRRIPR